MTTKESIQESVLEFRKAREWPQKETVEQLARMLVDEATEVRDHVEDSEHMPPPGLKFSDMRKRCERDWLGRELQEGYQMGRDRELIASDLADVGICLLALCDRLNIDLESEMEDKLEVLTDKYPTEIALILQALAEDPGQAADIPFDWLRRFWRDDDEGVDWDAVARNLTSDQRQHLCSDSVLDWCMVFDISRNLEKTDRQGIAAVIKTGVPVALEELLTYSLDLSDADFATIRQKLKQSDWRDLSEADIDEIRTSLQTSGSWVF